MKAGSFLLYILLLLLSSCNKKELGIKEYVTWVEGDNDLLVQKKQVGEFIFTFRLLPVEYKAAKGILEETIALDLYQQKLKRWNGMYYMNVSMDLKDKKKQILEYNLSSANEFQQRLYYLSYRMQNDLKMRCGNVEVPCGLYHFERNYGLKTGIDIAVGFENKCNENDLTFELNPQLFNTGLIKVTFLQGDLKKVPTLKI